MNVDDTEGVVAEDAAVDTIAAELFGGDIDMYTNDTVGMVDEDAVVDTVANVERETNFSFFGATPSQMNAKELKAIRAKHSPNKVLPTPCRFMICFADPGLGSSSEGSAVQLLLL